LFNSFKLKGFMNPGGSLLFARFIFMFVVVMISKTVNYTNMLFIADLAHVF
jgi:hypothetical protein